MKKFVIIIVALVFAAIGVFVLKDLFTSEEDNSSSSSTEQTQTTDDNPIEEDRVITMDEIAQHNSADDCWTAINGAVFDISEYTSRHPGGTEILKACGTDGTSLFQERTTETGETVGSGTPHSPNAEDQLAGFEIGITEEEKEQQ